MTRYTPQWLQAGSYAGSQDRRLISALWPGPAVNGCQVIAGTGMTVNVGAGQAAVPTQNSTGSTLCVSDNVEQVTLAAAPASGNNRYDLIICQPRGNDLDGGSNNDFIFTSVTGTAAASPTVPPTPPGALVLAQIYVAGGSASVVAGNITDVRPFGLPVTGMTRLISATRNPTSVNCSSNTTIMTVTLTLLVPRTIRMDCHITGIQQVVAGPFANVQVTGPDGNNVYVMSANNPPQNSLNCGHLSRVYPSLAAGAHTVTMFGSSSGTGGVLAMAPGDGEIQLWDCGP
ncbi:MAG TPA: hypothetical protein VGH66_00475 [Acidimicrobiales bacterium]|jgi:hypothetical protein